MRDIVLISFTPLNAGGGVPRWNRDFISAFPDRNVSHYSWFDVPDSDVSTWVAEWDRATILNKWLLAEKKVKRDDIIVSDGFWGDLLSRLGYNVISVAHGIWSHLTDEDVRAGKEPEFPRHHYAQVNHRRHHLLRGGRIVAVSDFIADEMMKQWGFQSTVINNGIDLEKFHPVEKIRRDRSLIIHGVTTANKGFDHIELLSKKLNADVLLLDEAERRLGLPKYESLAQADLVVHPSAYEGNSYFCIEALSCGVPLVAYDVGLLYKIESIGLDAGIKLGFPGIIMARKQRSPGTTLKWVQAALEDLRDNPQVFVPRRFAELFSLERFRQEWRSYVGNYERSLEDR